MLQATIPPMVVTAAATPSPAAPGQEIPSVTAAAPVRNVLQRHLLMALHCQAEVARMQQEGDTEGALRQQRLMGVFLHNALAHLPPA